MPSSNIIFTKDGTCLKCHANKEDNVHFLLKCQAYAAQRTEMVVHLSQLMSQNQDKSQPPTNKKQKELTVMLIFGTLDEAQAVIFFKAFLLYTYIFVSVSVICFWHVLRKYEHIDILLYIIRKTVINQVIFNNNFAYMLVYTYRLPSTTIQNQGCFSDIPPKSKYVKFDVGSFSFL